MSGFGGGFGSAPPNNVPPFGSPPNPPPMQFGGGGFGTPAPPASGFGAPPAAGFGASPAPAAFGGFGNQNPPNPSSFGSTAFGSSPSNPAAFGTLNTAASFGAPSSTPAFGTSNTSIPFGSSGGVISSGLGSTPPQATSTSVGFGSGSNTFGQPVFGAPAPAPFAPPSFSTTTGTGFGTSSTSAPFGASPSPSFGAAAPSNPAFGSQTPSVPNPFGNPAAAAPAPSITFGVSSNIAPIQTHAPFSGASSGFGSLHNTTTAFGTSTATSGFGSSSTTAPFGSSGAYGANHSDNEDMMDGGGGNMDPFGSMPKSTVSSSWPSNDRSLSPVPESSNVEDLSMSPTPAYNDSKAEEERLSQLRAKIQEKKKRLEEQKRRKEAAAVSGTITPEPVLNVNAPSFVPRTEAKPPARSDASSPVPVIDAKSYADRNAERFAPKSGTETYLPDDLKNRGDEVASGYKDGGPEATQDIENAVSLVGTCQYMCPDDELLRRQREGDIQLLEIPQPGTIHPQDWTLRNTAVKRFRRSAADYKLDVPEWVRPPDVLERVCAYLEEWVMERDRQGPDPRYPQSESPPPLDVYQFCWDRTRMVRKDFILQHYVGTGGKCDARAVRCHERIARWHAMCEHQLSHIPDFVIKQSQQNIQEFGQTMKTLNMYYDDSRGRSIVEVPDDDGNETRTDSRGITCGCDSDFVMGNVPVDYDGTPLKNDAASTEVSKRLIGTHRAQSISHGTAEPEMRGLYILLTMNNDGGMEVLKYAAYLFRNRPEVYHSEPVQLAMRIYKAKKEYNYARFFSILRDPSTPYLFACVMFKYVEQMRKFAFRIMAKTYGARRKDTGEAMYDAYPLKQLVRLLCFEDKDEARAACKHFNIAVKEVQVASSSSPSGKTNVEIVYWRISEFREPKDPSKGFVLPLKPRKMIRTIESKLNGATRLAVCRGEVSGHGASLTSVPAQFAVQGARIHEPKPVIQSPEEIEARRKDEEEAERAEEDRLRQMKEDAAKRKMEEKRRLKEEQKRVEEEKRQQLAIQREKEEEAKKQAAKLQKQREEELARKKAEDERIRRLEAEEAKRAAEAAAKEEELRRLAEEEQKAAEREAARKRAAAERIEWLRQEELRRKREEEELKQKLLREEEERKRKEAERQRLEQLRLQREREEQERRRREEEARRIAEAWEAKINHARKLLIWRRLRRRLDRQLRKERTRRSLSRIDPTFVDEPALTVNLSRELPVASEDSSIDSLDVYADLLPGIQVLDCLGRDSNPPLNLSAMFRKAFDSLGRRPGAVGGPGDTLLVKLAVVLPTFTGPMADSMEELIHAWLGRRLQYRKVVTDQPNADRPSFEIRTVVTNGLVDGCDMTLFIVPPFFGDGSIDEEYSGVCFPQSNVNVPQAILCLDNGSNGTYAEVVSTLLTTLPDAPTFQVDDQLASDDFDLALEDCCDVLLETFVKVSLEGNTRGCLVRLPISRLASMCIRGVLWRGNIHHGPSEDEKIMDRTRATLMAMIAELNSLADCFRTDLWRNWPAKEFVAGKEGVVKNYFGEDLDLPLDWKDYISRSEVEPAAMELYNELDGSFRHIIGRVLSKAPAQVKQDCEDMLAKRQFRRCLEYVLMWREAQHGSSEGELVVYLPKTSVRDVVEGCARRLDLDDDLDLEIETEHFDLSGEVHEDGNTFDAMTMQNVRALGEAPRLREEVELEDEDELDQLPVALHSTPYQRTPDSTAMTPAGVTTPLTANEASGEKAGFLKGNKRLLDSVGDDVYNDILQISKRQRSTNNSRNVQESNAFTEKLEALLNGETTFDMAVGKSTLSEILRDAPDIQLPSAFR